jgi:uncharacterized protein (TIGR02145 family)
MVECENYSESLGLTMSTFSSTMQDLQPATTYSVRAYCYHSNNVLFGEIVQFTTLDDDILPIVETLAITDIQPTSAIGGGDVIESGSTPVNSRGVCWAPFHYPDLTCDHTVDGSGLGEFTSILTGLTPDKDYFVRAYATNDSGTVYGSEVSFKTPGSGGTGCQGQTTLLDSRDGQVYPLVEIGTQCWMAKNLNYQTGNSWCFMDQDYNCSVYGRLYDWQTATSICPEGWHLPDLNAWQLLVTFLGGSDVAGDKLKESGFAHWESPNGGTNTSGFTGLPGGGRYFNGGFANLGKEGLFWSSTEYNSSDCQGLQLYYSLSNTYMFHNKKEYGFSVRCIRSE